GQVSVDWRIAGVGDLDGDGKADIIWRNNNGAVSIWLMNGAIVQQAAGIGTVGTDWTIAGVGDTNGDHKADIVWRNNNGSISTWFMDGVQVASALGIGSVGTEWHSCQRPAGPPLALAASQ